MNQPQSLGFSLVALGRVHGLRRDAEQTLRTAEECLSSSRTWPLPWRGLAMGLRGWALARLGDISPGLTDLREGIELQETLGARSWLPWFGVLLAKTCLAAGNTEEAHAVGEAALARIERTSNRQFHSPALTAKGDISLGFGNADVAERLYLDAIDIARAQAVKSWELLAATRLASLWHSRGKSVEARDLLAPVYGWFTEGFDTADLKDAKALLDELS